MAKNKTEGTSGDDKAKAPPPQSKNTEEAREDVDVDALANKLGGVSLFPDPRANPQETSDAPKEVKRLAALLSSDKYTNIVVLTGAGISVNAGIPDFRSPGSGLYNNLQKYNLPFPEAVFELGFYKSNPRPFVQLASELWPGKHSPTLTHSFIALLELKGMLLRNYTQNIDGLDVLAGCSEGKMVECHGNFRTASCTKCSRPYDSAQCKRAIVEKMIAPICTHCGGTVKPDITFFGESLPAAFNRSVKGDMKKADLLVVMGTSLMVGPVNMIPEMVARNCPRVLFNRELVGTFLQDNGPKSRKPRRNSANRDIFHEGDCDTTIQLLCKQLGWEKELLELNASTIVG